MVINTPKYIAYFRSYKNLLVLIRFINKQFRAFFIQIKNKTEVPTYTAT